MKEISLMEERAIYRDDFRVRGYVFGKGERAACVVGPMRGNEFQQQYICARLIERLEQIEEAGEIADGISILVVPNVNSYSMNTRKRFWTIDNTDINRMFPGGNDWETTQRIAHVLLSKIEDYRNGILLSSYYASGTFLSHVKILKTDRDYTEQAKDFGMPYVVLRNPRPFEKGTLNYNWQIKGCNAFSLYSTATSQIDRNSAHFVMTSILRFFKKQGLIKTEILGGYSTEILSQDEKILSIRTAKAGFFEPKVKVGFEVEQGDLLAEIRSPYDNKVIEEVKAPNAGVVFFMYSDPLAYSHSSVFKLILK